MLVHERMSHPVICVTPDMSLPDTLDLMRREKIRRAPVVKDGELVGIITQTDLLNASPSQATSLSVWEINYLLNKISVSQVMSKHVLSVTEDTPVEEAARIMSDNKIGGLPVVRSGHVVGIITETNLFRLFIEAMGARTTGVRLTALLTERPGRISRLAQAVSGGGGHVMSLVTFAGADSSNIRVTCKITGLSLETVRELVAPAVEKIEDIRFC